MPSSILDPFASWLCSRRIVWTLAEAGFLSARLTPLCIARAVHVPVRWEHLTGRESINTDDAAGVRREQGEGCRHA